MIETLKTILNYFNFPFKKNETQIMKNCKSISNCEIIFKDCINDIMV